MMDRVVTLLFTTVQMTARFAMLVLFLNSMDRRVAPIVPTAPFRDLEQAPVVPVLQDTFAAMVARLPVPKEHIAVEIAPA